MEPVERTDRRRAPKRSSESGANPGEFQFQAIVQGDKAEPHAPLTLLDVSSRRARAIDGSPKT